MAQQFDNTPASIEEIDFPDMTERQMLIQILRDNEVFKNDNVELKMRVRDLEEKMVRQLRQQGNKLKQMSAISKKTIVCAGENVVKAFPSCLSFRQQKYFEMESFFFVH